MVNSTLMFSFSCCYISLDRHNFPSMTHFLLPCSIIHISHHMECIFMSENIFSKICLISSLPISACFHTYLWPHVHFLPVLRSLFSDKLASSLQTRRPVRFLPLSSVYLYSCLLHEYDMLYFFLAEVFYTGYIFSCAFPTALLLL